MKICQYANVKGRNQFTGISIVDRLVFRGLYQFFNYPDGLNIKPLMRVLKNESGYDLMITIAMPHSVHWAMGKLYNKGVRVAKRWVADCGDPFMLTESNSFRPPFYFKPL